MISKLCSSCDTSLHSVIPHCFGNYNVSDSKYGFECSCDCWADASYEERRKKYFIDRADRKKMNQLPDHIRLGSDAYPRPVQNTKPL